MDRHQERIRHQEWISGIVACAVANHSTRHPEKWLEPNDFFAWELTKGSRRKRITKAVRAQVADSVRAFFGPLTTND